MGIGRHLALVAPALVVALAPLGAAAQSPPKGNETIWYSIVAADGSIIGHSSAETTETANGRTIVQSQELLLAGDSEDRSRISERSVVIEDAGGHLMSASSVSRNGRRQSTREARRLNDQVMIREDTPGGRREHTLDVPATVRFDGGEALLKTWNPAVDGKLEFEQFNAESMKVERVVLEPLSPATDGLTAVTKRRYEGDALVGVSRLLLDKNGQVVAVTQPMFGASITIRTVDRATALKPHRAYRVLNNVMTKSPVRISDAAGRGHIRYRFSFRDGMVFDLPQTGEQAAVTRDGVATVDICDACGPTNALTEAARSDALKPTTWLQSDHPKIRAVVARATRPGLSETTVMQKLTVEARSYLRTIDFKGHYSALETLSRQKGDCTEAAVLLAALGRAAGIPTKVANGLVYSRERYHGVSNVFMPHSWVLAFVDGRWRSYDAALDQFDATHIALTVGDGDSASIVTAGQLASLLQWDSMAEVRTRPTN